MPLLSLRSGVMDISDLWGFLLRVTIVCLPALGLVLSRRIENRWVRVPVRAMNWLLAFPAALLLLFFCLTEASCQRRAAPLYAPDGRHLALQRLLLTDATNRDYAEVLVRPAWSPFATTVFAGEAPPQVDWLDNSTLRIKVQGDGDCRRQSAPVRVVCEHLPRQ